MGCWDETCALTHIGIREGDAVVRVEAEYPRCALSHDLMFGIFRDRSSFKRVRSVMVGKYDDYGGLIEDPRKAIEEGIAVFFFHADAWAWSLEEYNRICEGWWRAIPALLTDPFESRIEREIKWPDDIEEFIKVSRVCDVLGRPLIIPPKGPQSRADSFPSQLRMAQFIQNKIETVKKEYRYDDD